MCFMLHTRTLYTLKSENVGFFSLFTDDRFVIKEMSRPEAQSFLNIAPYYFQYIEKAIQEKVGSFIHILVKRNGREAT